MDQQNTTNSNNKLLLTIAGIAIVGAAGFIYNKYAATPQTVSQINSENSSMTTSESIKPENVTVKYKDGTYTQLGDYISPGGPEQVEVTLTLKDDVIQQAEVVSKAERPTSVQFQGKFISGFKEYVVGKNIDDVVLDKVSGSSLTPKGFNDALSKIKDSAKS